MAAGRPSEYSLDLAQNICELTSHSNMSLKSVCESVGVSVSSVFRWREEFEEFRKMYARSKEDQADYLAEEIIEIADDSSNDLERIDDFGNRIENKEFVNRSRLRVDARKWVAAKLKPRKYGDKVDVTTDGDKLPGIMQYEVIKPIED